MGVFCRYREYRSLARKAAATLTDERLRAEYDELLQVDPSQRALKKLPHWMRDLPSVRQESWSWCWESLWRPGLPDHRRLVANVADTVMIVNGEPARWFFTSKDGYVKTKLSGSLKPDKILSQWKSWHQGQVKAVHRHPEGGEMGGSLVGIEELEHITKKIMPTTALQRYREPVNGMYRTTLTRKEGLEEAQIQTDMLSLIGCDIKVRATGSRVMDSE